MRRPFADTLRDIRGGAVLDDLAEEMQKLVDAVASTGKGGSLTLKLDIKPMAQFDGAVVVTDDIKTALPKLSSNGTVMFTTPEGNLSRKNPKQDDLPGLTIAQPTKQGATA